MHALDSIPFGKFHVLLVDYLLNTDINMSKNTQIKE